MRFFISFVLLILFNSMGMAQTNIELSVPLGLSNYTPSTIERVKSQTNIPNLNIKYHVSTGAELLVSPWHDTNIEFLFGITYLRLQNKTIQTQEQESYSWTYRHTDITIAEHHLGANIQFRYYFFRKPSHKIGLSLNYGVSSIIANEAWVEQERHSYFYEEPEYFEYYESEVPEDSYDHFYTHYRLQLIYIKGKTRLKGLAKMGYAYMQEVIPSYENQDPFNWNNFFISIGAKYYLSELKTADVQKKE